MAQTIRQEIAFSAPPGVLFGIYMASKAHAAATGAKASISRRVGGKFMAHAGHIRGRNLAIVRDRLIVQTWRGSNWKKDELDSILVLRFSKAGAGGHLSMVHVNVPDAHAKSINSGWHQYYWKPWKAYLKTRALQASRRPGRASR
ncbi:MAG: hypothetical protein C5B48_09335 [Candidatus Rokuibacteriota bacterium]|nr:MAG: hypothetical protein C5B48_09335 [Candidatus Rokubacteria bacterium]